jgi:uncharacterized membrane protein YidH (DUF202 family)
MSVARTALAIFLVTFGLLLLRKDAIALHQSALDAQARGEPLSGSESISGFILGLSCLAIAAGIAS